MAHIPHLNSIAAENNYNLYLCGHTHGGQVCLPGEIPFYVHRNIGRKFAKGLWEYSGMKGYTHRGCGVASIPVRFYSHGEITLITLKKI